MPDLRDKLSEFINPFGTLPEGALDLLLPLVHTVELPRTGFLIRAGETTDRLAWIVNGCLRYYYLRDGEEITGEFWQEGELAGSYESSILRKPSSLFIEAIEDSSLIVFSYADLKGLTGKYPGLNTFIIKMLEKFIVESQERIASFIMETPEQRYLRLREEMPGIEDRVHQKYIASFLGVTPVTLSRIRARLAGKNK